MESCETLHHRTLKVSDGQLAVASPSVPLDRNIPLFYDTSNTSGFTVKQELLTKHSPTRAQWKDIEFGWPVAKEMGRLDVGQTITVKDRSVVAIEALEGADECILRSGKLCRGFIVIKIAKPRQDDTPSDPPTFGMTTIKNIVEAGGKALVVEADRTMFTGHEDVIDYADKNSVAIILNDEEI